MASWVDNLIPFTVLELSSFSCRSTGSNSHPSILHFPRGETERERKRKRERVSVLVHVLRAHALPVNSIPVCTLTPPTPQRFASSQLRPPISHNFISFVLLHYYRALRVPLRSSVHSPHLAKVYIVSLRCNIVIDDRTTSLS